MCLCADAVAELKNAYARMTSRDPKRFWTSGQWMTEKAGGSDVGNGTNTIARKNPVCACHVKANQTQNASGRDLPAVRLQVVHFSYRRRRYSHAGKVFYRRLVCVLMYSQN